MDGGREGGREGEGEGEGERRALPSAPRAPEVRVRSMPMPDILIRILSCIYIFQNLFVSYGIYIF